MRKISFILLILLGAMNLSAQLAATAETQFSDEKYADALLSYEQLLQQSPHSALYLYRYARCAQETGDYNKAIDYFTKAGNTYKLKHFFIAECYFATRQMDLAIESYQTYLNVKPDTDRKDYVLAQIEKAEKLKRYLKRENHVVLLDSFLLPKARVLEAYQLSDEAGKLTQDSIGFGYKNQFGNRWTYATAVDSLHTILVRQYRLLNIWGDTDTLPARINQFSEQNSPYWLSDGITLYFSANNPDGLGGLDIYVTRYNTSSETYTIPENIGMPFNSPGNDYLYVLDETKGVGYWATDQYSTPDSVRVYKFESKEPILWTAE